MTVTFAHADTEASVSDRFVSLAIQGELQPALEMLTAEAEADQANDAQALLEQFRQRFLDPTESHVPNSGSAFIDALTDLYRQYWARAMMREISLPAAEAQLEARLKALLGGSPVRSSGDAYGALTDLGQHIREAGYHYYDNPAPPFRDLFLWKKQETRTFQVALTDRTQPVTVVFMDEMYSRGWKHYASLGLASTSGWVEDGTLYCVSSAYDRNSERFEVSYLKHEARHLADFQQFPGLASVDLEYRAKLTELAFATRNLERLLDDFTKKSAENGDSPHAMANYRVTRDLYRELHGEPFPTSGEAWRSLSVGKVNRSARRLLKLNTAALQAASTGTRGL